MGAVLSLWHECREDAKKDEPIYRIPTADELKEASKHCDINDLIIDEEAKTVYLRDPDMSLDVGAIGKGYATEKAAELLISRGVTSYVLNIGGNIRTIGEKPNGDGWMTGIVNPDRSSSDAYITKLTIKDTALVTSGNYERFHTVDGVNYHHIIDPDTLMPANYFSSISILTKDSALADALSTALFCMTYEDGLALVQSLEGVEVIWVDLEYNVKHTAGISIE
jgi:thiamine biosynthesis lipoprotein